MNSDNERISSFLILYGEVEKTFVRHSDLHPVLQFLQMAFRPISELEPEAHNLGVRRTHFVR